MAETESHFLLVAVGGAGDVFPLLTIADALRRRGHRTTLAAATQFADQATRVGVQFVPISNETDYGDHISDMVFLHGRYQWLHYARHAVLWNERIYQTILALASSRLLVVAADRSNLWADLAARRHALVSTIRLLIDLPPIRKQRSQMAELPPGPLQRRLIARCDSAWRKAASRIGLHVGPYHIGRIMQSTRPVIPTIALWPESLVGIENVPSNTHAFGFVLPYSMDDTSVPFDPHRSAKPLVIFVAGTKGTTKNWLKQFMTTSIAICNSLGCEGILVGADGSALKEKLPDYFRCHEFIPLLSLCAHAVAIVHHGGIGTAAIAIQCRLPQLIVPRVFAQPDNAEWLRRKGLCLVLSPKDYTVGRGSVALRRLLLSRLSYRRSAVQFASTKDSRTILDRVCNFLESRCCVN